MESIAPQQPLGLQTGLRMVLQTIVSIRREQGKDRRT
jgi:hypothetical protein